MGKKANYTLSKRIVLTLKDLKSPRNFHLFSGYEEPDGKQNFGTSNSFLCFCNYYYFLKATFSQCF